MRLIASAATALALLTTAPAQAEPTLFIGKARLGTVQGMELTPAQRSVFRNFRAAKSYFGAFYIRPGTDFSGNTLNFHSLDAARSAARQICETTAGAPCTLYAVTYPAGTDPNTPGLSGLSQPAQEDFRGPYQTQQIDGKFGAFAINGANGYGYAFGWENAAEARASAIEFCNADSSQTLAHVTIEGRKWARERDLHICRVVDVHTP